VHVHVKRSTSAVHVDVHVSRPPSPRIPRQAAGASYFLSAGLAGAGAVAAGLGASAVFVGSAGLAAAASAALGASAGLAASLAGMKSPLACWWMKSYASVGPLHVGYYWEVRSPILVTLNLHSRGALSVTR